VRAVLIILNLRASARTRAIERSRRSIRNSATLATKYAAFSEHDSNQTARSHNRISSAVPALCPQSGNKRAKQREISISSWDFVATTFRAGDGGRKV
jgi:hypothetical protein